MGPASLTIQPDCNTLGHKRTHCHYRNGNLFLCANALSGVEIGHDVQPILGAGPFACGLVVYDTTVLVSPFLPFLPFTFGPTHFFCHKPTLLGSVYHHEAK